MIAKKAVKKVSKKVARKAPEPRLQTKEEYDATHCLHPDRDFPNGKMKCGYPLPCPHHTATGGRIFRAGVLVVGDDERVVVEKVKGR